MTDRDLILRLVAQNELLLSRLDEIEGRLRALPRVPAPVSIGGRDLAAEAREAVLLMRCKSARRVG